MEVSIRESLLVRVMPNHYLSECLILEIDLRKKKGYLVSLYRFPNQNLDEFELFFYKFRKSLR